MEWKHKTSSKMKVKTMQREPSSRTAGPTWLYGGSGRGPVGHQVLSSLQYTKTESACSDAPT